MVKINYRVVIAGMICLTSLSIARLVTDHVDGTLSIITIGIISMAIGIMIPNPKIDNKRGLLTWRKKKI